MDRLLVLLAICLGFTATACWGSVTIGGGEQAASDGGSGGSGGTAATETITTEPATGGSGGQEQPPELIVSYLGPSDGVLQLGSTDHLFDFSLMAKSHTLSISSIKFVLASTDGAGFLLGSSGTVYFTKFKILDVDGIQIMGPEELILAVGDQSATVTFDESMVLPPGILTPGKPNLFRLVADLSATEDADGELMGKVYFVSLPPFQLGDVTDLQTGLPLEPTQITPQTALNGNPMGTVVAY